MKIVHLILIGLLIGTNGYGQTFSEGLASKKSNKKWGFVDTTEKEIIPYIYDNVNDFSEGLASVKLNGKWGFIDKTGKEVIPFEYDDAYSFWEGLAIVKLNKKYGFVDNAGNEVIPFKYDDAYRFSEGLARVKLNKKYGFVDKTGNEVISIKYDAANSFSEGLASVRLEWKYGFVDKTGKEVIPFTYYDAGNFSESMANVKLDGKVFYITKTGKEVSKIIWKSIEGSTIRTINDYRSELYPKITKNSNSFQINRPYLAVFTDRNLQIDTENDIFILKYSEESFDEKDINDVKTIVIVYGLQTYVLNDSPDKIYGRMLIYYDVDKQECIGHEIIGTNTGFAHERIDTYMALRLNEKGSKDYIVEKIECHLANRICK